MKKPVLVAMATVVTPGIVPMASARADGPSDEASFVAEINALRATRGAPALEIDAGLTARARSWAGTMAGQNTIWHSSMNSPHHYDNLVDLAFRSVGIGVVRNRARVLFVAEEFMVTQPPAAAPPARWLPAPRPSKRPPPKPSRRL